MGKKKKKKEFGDFFWLEAAAVLLRWLRFPGKQGVSSKL